MLEDIIPIINLHASGRSYGNARMVWVNEDQRYIEFNLTLKKFRIGMMIGSDLWVLFTNLQREFGLRTISEIHFSDDKRTTVMHANYFLMCETKIANKKLMLDDYPLDIELLVIRLYENDSA